MKEVLVSRTTLRDERARLLLRQQDLADKTGLSLKAIRNAEQGEPIAVSTARAILKALNETRTEYGMATLTPDDLDWNVET